MTELEKMIAEFDSQNGTVKTQLSTDNSTPETTDLASMIAEFDRQNANLSDDKQEEAPTESPKINEWGEPVDSLEKPAEVEYAGLKDFLTPTIFEQKSNAKSKVEPAKATKEEKPYNPEGLLPITEPGQTEIPPTFISSKIFEEFTPEEKLMLDVDKATDSAFNAAQEEASAQSVKEDLAKTPWQRAFEDDTYDATKNQVSLRKTAGADAVIKRTFESISADNINTIIENRVANNEEFKTKKQAFDDEVKRIMPNSNDNLSDAEVEALFANMTPEEREVAEKQIAETTQALEALQTQFASDVEAIYKSESKDVEAQINNRIINRLAKLNLPKSDLEYIGKAIYNNSLVGTLYEIGLNAAAGGSGADYIVSQQAMAQSKPSAIAKVVGGAGAILADGVIFGALSAGGSLVGAALRNKVASVVAGQIARKAAVSATNTAVKATARRIVEKKVLQQFAEAATAQAITLGGYNGLLTAAQETLSPTGENGAYNWRNVFHRMYEGALIGVALGGVSVGTNAAKGAMYRARPDMAYTATGMAADLGVSLAGFTAENAAFLGIGSIVSGEEITAEAIGESFATLGLLKGVGALKRVAKGEKLMQQPDFVERTISDLKFTKEEMDAMRNAGVDMEQIDIVSEAVREVLNTPNKSLIAQETISSRPLMDVYNSVMASREVPISAKIKLQYIVNGTAPRIVGATSITLSNTNGVPTVKAYDANSRLVQVREFENMAEAESFVNKAQPLLERNSIIEGEKVLRGGQIAVTIQQAIEQYAKENPNTDARTLFTELMIDLGYVKGEVPASSRERVDAIKSRIKEQFVDPAAQLVDGIARKYGTTVESVYHALNIKPDLRTVRESQLVKAYVDGLKQFNGSMSGPVEAEQARYNAQMQPQIEQGKQEIVDAQRETEFVRNSLNEAAKRMATADGKQIAIVRLENGEQVAVHTGRIVLREDGTIDHKASEQTIVIKRIDAEGNEQRDSVGIDDIAEVIEQGTPEEAVEASMSVLEAQATKKLSLDKALSENGDQGVEVVAIDGTRGKIVGIDENGSYILRAKGESGKEVDVPVSINDIEAINAEQPATTEQAAVADAVEKVVEDAATVPVEVVYDDDFPPLTEADMAPQLDADKIQWEKLSPEDYASASAMLYGDATTLADSHIYHTNSRAKLAKAKQSVAEQQKVIDKLNSRFATLSSPAEAQKLRKQVAAAEQEKAKREQTVKNIEEQMAKYAHAMRKYGVEVATEDNLLAERARLEEERNVLLETDKELDRYEQEEATKGKKAIANTAANRKYIEQLYADRFGVSPAQAGPRQAILWDLANGAIKLRWDNVTTDSGAVQKGLAAELGLSAAEKRIYKAVTDNKNGQSVDAYAHDLWQGAEWGQDVDDMALKDMILEVLQSTPNGSIALKELADMSGVQADLEAQISLGKGDIQRKLEEVDAKIAKNAQQMADFRKRINDTVQKLESGEPLILPVGEGEFGPIYDQFKGKPQEAVDFLLSQKNGEAIGALTHPEIGDVSLVYGNEFAGLEKIAQKHPEVLNDLQNVLSQMSPIMESANRIKLESPSHFAVVSKEYMGAPRDKWLLTAYEKKSSASNNRMDTDGTVTGRRNDTATSQDTTYSENKDTTTIPVNQISEEEFYGKTPLSEEVPFMIEQKPTEQAVSETEQNFNREVFDAFAGHLGETLGAESVVTDTAEIQSVFERHQAVGERLRTAVSENAEIAAERTEIEQVAKENGTWLKVPNGKDTNLSPKQWVEVRTSRFKSWFGDMEKAFRVAKLRDSKSVAIPNNINEGKYELTQESAENYILQNMRKGYRINDTGETVFIHRKGAQKVTSHSVGNEAHLKSIAAIPEMLEKAIFIEEVSADPNKSKAKYDFYRYYICGLRIGAEDYTVRLTIGVKQGKHYYDHSLTEIEKGNLIEIANGFIPQGGRTIPANAIGKDTKLIPLLQINSSKVVDTNGEPMVVYHGTPNQFNTFNRELIGSSTDRGIWGRGFYFTSNKAEAERYTKRGDATGEVKEVFLNIRKPLAIKAEQGDAGKEYIQSLYRKHVTDEIFEDPRTTDAKLAEATQKVTDELVDNGYDGVVVTYKDGTQEYVVFNPNQIKSATDNTGEYSPANDDIRMSIQAYHGSGASFDKFDDKFMGTGEGAQAFGWGIYVTEVENIGRAYAKASAAKAENNIQHQLLSVRRQIADNRITIENAERRLSELKESYARVERELQQTEFAKTMSAEELSRLKFSEDTLRHHIEAEQTLIDISTAAIERLAPTEEFLAKEWEKVNVAKKIEELKQLIELNKHSIDTWSAKVEKLEKALENLEQGREVSEQFAKDLIELVKLNAELRGEDVVSDKEIIVANIDKLKNNIKIAEDSIATKHKEIDVLQVLEQPKYRNLYSVEVPDNTGENYLSWDKNLTPEQKDRIYPQVEKAFAAYLEDARNRPEAESIKGFIAGIENIFEKYVQGEERSGEQIYGDLLFVFHSHKAASEFLHSIGFTGIEYPAQYTTGGRADGAKNYVIFNADDVKIVDHMQYFKTPNGEVYGFVYEDKIYLDPTNIDPKAPVHEYTELWCREVAKANEALWKRGKEIVQQTKVWEEVNADENYKDLDEDLRASEAWSRIIADEMMGKAREYGSKGLMAKLRGWLRSFWKTVKSVVGKWTKKDLDDLTVEQFKKMTMADFINQVDPRKWNAKKPKEVSKSHKQAQLDIIKKHNPMQDDVHTGIRKVEDIKSFDEVLGESRKNQAEYGELTYPDMNIDMMESAAESGMITVYSSYPIEQGVFVTPSYMNAQDYAGGSGRVYQATVPVDDVAWIAEDEGQYARVETEPMRPMIIGEKGAAELDRVEEATTRLDNLVVARKMEAANGDAKAIRLATGWERGADGKWRYEIPDFDSPLIHDVPSIEDAAKNVEAAKQRELDFMRKHKGHLSEPYVEGKWAIFRKHIRQAEALQKLAEFEKLRKEGLTSTMEFRFEDFVGGGDAEALLQDPSSPYHNIVIRLNSVDAYPDGYKGTYIDDIKRIDINLLHTDSLQSGYKTLVHEVQHAIQMVEGFARGGNPNEIKPDSEEWKALRESVRQAISFIDFFKNDDIANAIREGRKYKWVQWESLSQEAQDMLNEYLGRKRKVDYNEFREYLSNAFDMTLRDRPYGMAKYKKFAGEVEARNVQTRMGMTPEERRATLLAETEDVAREDQIFLSNNLGVAQSIELSEPVEAPTRKPRKSAAEKSLEKIESLREQLQNKKRSLENTLADVYNFLTSKDIAETMAEGVGKAQYRSVIKNAIEAIGKAYNITDAEEKRKVVFRYLGEIDDNLSQLLTRQRLNEVTDILDKAIYGYTAQGVRTGKRIDEHTREIFDMLRNAIAEPVEEERDERGYRKPVHYRLKNRTEAGDITSSFRLRTQSSNDVGVIAKLRSDADEIINSVDYLDTATTRKAAQLEYTANLLEKYDNTLQLNEAIGQSTDEIAQILDNIDRVREKYKSAAVGSEERKNLYDLLKQLKTDLESEKMNRANLRHRYASMLKTFTTSLEQLDEKGASEFVRAEQEKAEAAIKWRKGIYDSIKNPNAPVLPVGSKDRKGEEITVNWKGLNTRAKINESVFMATFAEMSRDIDINSIPGQWLPDGWYYQFMLAPGGYMERTDWRYKTEKALRGELDAEILKLSGDKKTDEPYKLFAQLAQEPSGMTIQRMAVSKNDKGKDVGGYQENIPLTIGQLLYMRNTLRQPNGFAGYNAWGFAETYMQNMVEYVEAKYPQYCRFFDWVVSEFMPKLYDMQDAIYFKKFGTHLPKTAFYFPFVRDKRMVGKVAEVGEGEVSLPSSVTGNIVERVKTSAKMDLEADAFSVLQDHIKETLDWCAYSELTDKFNSVATSHAFGNILKAQGVSVQKLREMYEIAIGQGKINSTENTTLTKVLNAASKGLVAGNIVLNLNSAAKQLVSGSCALGYTANPKIIPIWAKNFFVPSAIKTGVGRLVQQIKGGELDPVEVINWKAFADNWKWAIENIPTLRQRWEGRNAGFEVLKSHSFESWDKLSSIITRFGLAPNATIDMFTCANVAKTVYEYEYPRLLERGRSKEEAHREACVKSAIFTNETQQSGIDAFLSSFQSGGGLQRLLGVGLGAYQNTSMAFARNERFAITNMLRMLNPATREQMIARQVKAYKELGFEGMKARELAKSDFKESQGQQFSAFIHNGIVSNLLWTLAGTLLTTAISGGIAAMFGGKEEWEKMKNNEKFRDELSSALSIETIAWQTPLFYNAPIFKQLMTYAHNASNGKTYGGIFESPSSQSAQEMIDAIFKQWIGIKNEVTGEREREVPTRYDRTAEWLVFSTLVKAGLGVNPDLVARMAEGVDAAIKDGVQVEDIMNVLSSPRGLTRAIAGESRQGETKEEYLNRMAYIYRQINAQDKKFVKERTKEYIDNKDNELYRTLGIVPREERILEQKVKAIRKQLLFFDRSDEGVAEFRALPEADRKKQIEIAKRYDKITKLTKEMYQGILPFDEAGVSKRKQELQKRHDMMREVYDMWIEYNNK